jgi:multidrug efflux pump subunit AcrA (membrane-fusion protein)
MFECQKQNQQTKSQILTWSGNSGTVSVQYMSAQFVPQRTRNFYYRHANYKTGTALAVLVIFLVAAVYLAATKGGIGEEGAEQARLVSVKSVAELTGSGQIIQTIGEVKSQSQADLRAKKAGIITNVYAKVGVRVSAGVVIAAIENAAQIAAVQQAQAGVSEAEANLRKVAGGTREEQLAVLSANTSGARTAYVETQAAANNTLLSTYAGINNAITGGVDTMFNNPESANPTLKVITTESTARIRAEHERFLMQSLIERNEQTARNQSEHTGAELEAALAQTEKDLREIKILLDDIVTALGGAITTAEVSSATIVSYESTATAARTSILSSLSGISSVRSGLSSAQTALAVAEENERQGVSGAQSEDFELAEAQLARAKANLASAAAGLEDTRIRTPVSGTLTTLSIETGSFVTIFQSVGVVANQNALEVVAFFSAEDLEGLSVGSRALIDDTYDAVVTSIAPGLDAVRRQIEVRIGVTGTSVPLPHGKSVKVLLYPRTTDVVDSGPIIIPIAVLKLRGDEAFVFTVSRDNTLVLHPVTLGTVTNTSVEITSGLVATDEIVADARGLNEGDEIVIKDNGSI